MLQNSKRLVFHVAVVFASGLTLAGCMSVTPDGGMSNVAALTQAGIGIQPAKIDSDIAQVDVDERVRGLLRKPLTANRAVQIALLRNRNLQAAYNELGISEAQYVQAALPPNPTISVARFAASLELEIERQILVNLLGLITLPEREKISQARIRQAQIRAASETLKVASQARNAFYRAVSARQTVSFLTSANANARIVSQLFKKLGETGAVNKLDQAREHVFYAEIAGQLGKARMDLVADRERLVRAMGLWGKEASLKLPASIPQLPAKVRARPNVEREAIERNIQIKMAKAELDATILALGLTNATRMINVFEVRGLSSYSSARSIHPVTGDIEKDKVRRRGVELELQIPIFDFGKTRQREAEQTYARAFNLLVARAVDVRSIARESYQRYRGAYDQARHYQRAILPLRKIISDESMLRYNAMLVDIVPILAEARQRIASNVASINARRDFWIAEADLRAAIIGGGGAGGGEGAGEAVMVSAGAGAGH